MKKTLAMLLTFCIMLSALCLPAAAEGNGEKDWTGYTPISSWGELYTAMTGDATKNYYLTEDISINDEDSALKDLDQINLFANRSVLGTTESYYWNSSTDLADKGTAFTFKGIFDGNGHTIDFGNKSIHYSGYHNQKAGTTNGGFLFYQISGTVKNLNLIGINLDTIPTGGSQHGLLAANATGDYTIENVHVTGTYKKTGSNVNFGLVGRQSGDVTGSIKNCSMSIVATGDNESDNFAGFVGSVSKGSVSFENCVVTGSVTTEGKAAGLVGNFGSTTGTMTAKNCVNLATLAGGTTGAFVASGEATVNNCIDLSATGAFDVLTGARIRLSSGENAAQKSGIRYDVAISEEMIAALEAAGCTVKFGSLVWATDATPGYALTAEAMKASGKAYSEKIFDKQAAGLRGTLPNETQDGTCYGYTVALTNITNTEKAYSCRAFIDVTFTDGSTVRIYTDYNATENSRCVKAIATAAWEDHSDPNTDTNYSGYEALLKTLAGIAE